MTIAILKKLYYLYKMGIFQDLSSIYAKKSYSFDELLNLDVTNQKTHP